MPKIKGAALLALTISLIVTSPSNGQSQDALARQHFDAARKAAGTEWGTAADYFSMTADEIRPSLPSSGGAVPVEPMQVFDNLYLLGYTKVAVWTIRTTEGLVLIDAGGELADKEGTILAGMNQLGLDPRGIRYVLLAHGHSDHYGGAKAFQERFGARVGMSGDDWDFIQPKPGTPVSGDIPKRDLTLVDGETLTVGDIRITPVLIPGHTPGSMGFIFAVRDRAITHTAALFGGMMLLPTAPLPQVREYLRSIEHFQEVTRRLGADVELLNHPLMDDLFVKLEQLKKRQAGNPHPLVVGRDGYQRFLTVMYESMKGQLARRGELTAP